MDRIVVALVGAPFLRRWASCLLLVGTAWRENFPRVRLMGGVQAHVASHVSGMCFMIFGAIVLIAVLVFPLAGS